MAPRRTSKSPRGVALRIVLGLGLVVGLVAMGLFVATNGSRSPAQREAAARVLLNGIHASVSVNRESLAATQAIADFGVGKGIRLVRVRIAAELDLTITINTEGDVAFVEPPLICLVGPFPAPDDAGLSEPCWGEPDATIAVAERLPRDATGHPLLRAGQLLVISLTLRRGDVRCDYPPGSWTLDVKADPLIDGASTGATYIRTTPFEVPWDIPGEPLQLLRDTRYCGLADSPYTEQGEPAVQNP